MKISYEWLSSLVAIPQDPEELVAEFVRTGTEVEGIEHVGAHLDKVVTAEIVSKEPHPDSDHMWLCKVNVGMHNVSADGTPEPLQIVCGAQNFNEGDKIVCALIGAVLPGDFKIKKSKLRGVESCGMNCSARELGLGESHDGIMILPPETPVGLPISEYLGLSDTVIDAEITPNRPDCMSMRGLARECAALYDVDVVEAYPEIQHEADVCTADALEVHLDDPEICQRYCARVIKDVSIAPSPEWLRRRLEAAGVRSINNVVDITNYVMMLTGQPLHAFDASKLATQDGTYVMHVRRAQAGETIVTLDEVERVLNDDTIVIADAQNTPVALGGVMGGLNSQVDDQTTDIVLESAAFLPRCVSHTSRKLDLMSESSLRFERQIDETFCDRALTIAAALMEDLAQATCLKGSVDVYPAPKEPVVVSLRPERVSEVAGAIIDREFMVRRLRRLGVGIDDPEAPVLNCVIPANRPDLTREIDLVEEVMRLWGVEKIEATLPAARNHAGGLNAEQRLLRRITALLRAQGLSETTTYCFADPRDLEQARITPEGKGRSVELMSPLVADQSEMRRSLLPGLLRSVQYNLDHGVSDIFLYELGRVFFGRSQSDEVSEPTYIAAVMSGSLKMQGWNEPAHEVDFYDAKGMVEALCELLHLPKVRFREIDPERMPHVQPGRAAEVISEGEILGWVGNVHPLATRNFDIKAPVVAFELSLAALLKKAADRRQYVDIPVYPGITQDLALVVDEEVTYETLKQRLTSAGGKLLASVELFDVYRSEERLGAGKKSMAFSLVYRSPERTLTSEEVETLHQKVVEKVCRSVGAQQRG